MSTKIIRCVATHLGNLFIRYHSYSSDVATSSTVVSFSGIKSKLIKKSVQTHFLLVIFAEKSKKKIVKNIVIM